MPWEQIRDCSLDISVMDFDTIGRNEMIGRLMLGCEYLSMADNILHIWYLFSQEHLRPSGDKSVGRNDCQA